MNAGALLGDWPRIPPATADFLAHSATRGRRLAELLDPESGLQLLAEWGFLARILLPPEHTIPSPEESNRLNAALLALTAGWGGVGQGATVVPRHGDAREHNWTDTALARLATLAASQSLALEQLSPSSAPAASTSTSTPAPTGRPSPLNVWNYTLGGYEVLEKWLSYREQPSWAVPFREDEVQYFAQVVRLITAILIMGPALDGSYAAILPSAKRPAKQEPSAGLPFQPAIAAQ